MSSTKEPDRLSRHSSEALAMGMFYGKYMALRHDLGLDRRGEMPGFDTVEPAACNQRSMEYCAICGGLIPQKADKGGRPRKYCSEECAHEAQLEQNKSAVRRHRSESR